MMKDRIKKSLKEAKFMASADDLSKIMPKLEDDDMVKIVDEDINEDSGSDSRAIEYGIKDGELGDEDWEELLGNMTESDNTVDSSKLKIDVAKFMDKLNLHQFDTILAKIDKPIEQAEIIAAFAERIGVPRQKLPSVVASIKAIAENTNPKITKDSLVEFITRKK